MTYAIFKHYLTMQIFCPLPVSPLTALPSVPMFDFDYTFTTPYAGNVEIKEGGIVEHLPPTPDTSSFVQRKAQDVAIGGAKVSGIFACVREGFEHE